MMDQQQYTALRRDVDAVLTQSKTNAENLKVLTDALQPLVDVLELIAKFANGLIIASKWAKILIPIIMVGGMAWGFYLAIRDGHTIDFSKLPKIGE